MPPIEQPQEVVRQSSMPMTPFIAVFIVLLVTILIVGFVRQKQQAPKQTETNTAQIASSAFNGLTIDGHAAYVYDIRTRQVLFEKLSEEQLPLASLTKLMTTLVATEQLNPNTLISFAGGTTASNGKVLSGKQGEQWKLHDLIDVALVNSSNEAAAAIGEAVTHALSGTTTDAIGLMNQRAQDLGLRQTYFLNPSGLDVDPTTLSGAYGSARDVAHLVAYIIEQQPHLLEATQRTSTTVYTADNTKHTLLNTNTELDALPWVIGSKTGYTDLAGGNLAVAFDAGINHPMVAVVLGSTRESRFTDIKKLIDTTFVALRENGTTTKPTHE